MTDETLRSAQAEINAALLRTAADNSKATVLRPEAKIELRRMIAAASKGSQRRRQLRSLITEDDLPYYGLTMHVSPQNNYTDMRIWLDGKSPEHQSQDALAAHIRGKACFICDIGANSGSYALMCAAHAGAGSVIHAFEPNPTMADQLLFNVTQNRLQSLIKVHQVALSGRVGEATLSIPPGNYGEATLGRSLRRVGETLTVRTAPLTDFVSSRAGYERFVIKIDVEGHEDHVLCPFLESVGDDLLPDVVLIETEHRANWSQDLIGLFTKRGYQSRFEAEGNTLYIRQ